MPFVRSLLRSMSRTQLLSRPPPRHRPRKCQRRHLCKSKNERLIEVGMLIPCRAFLHFESQNEIFINGTVENREETTLMRMINLSCFKRIMQPTLLKFALKASKQSKACNNSRTATKVRQNVTF